MIAGASLFFPRIHIKYVVFMSLWPRTIRILISNWPRKRQFSQFFFKVQARKTLSYHGHALVTLYVQFLYSNWSKFDRWVNADKLCSILIVVYFDSWSWQCFVSTCDVFNCLFPLDVQNEIQLLSRVFCYSWLDCLLGFWLRNASLVKIRWFVFGWHRFRFSPCLMRKRVKKSHATVAFLDSFQELNLEWQAWLIIVFDVCFCYI